MCACSIGPSTASVLSTQRKESSTDPTAMALTTALEARRPSRPFARKPASGNAGISQRCNMGSILHRIHFVDLQRAAVLEYRKDNRKADSGLRRGHHHHEERIDMPVNLFELIG